MLDRIHIENFKGIKKKIVIELRPVTLLFGPNSAGKSSIIKALLYAKEIFLNNNIDPDGELNSKYGANLGSFKELIHKHDLRRTIKLGFDLDLMRSGDALEYDHKLELEEMNEPLAEELISSGIQP